MPPNRQANSPGDIQYNYDRLTELLGSFDPMWGAFKNISFPAPGNHEWYDTPNRQDFEIRRFDGSTVRRFDGVGSAHALAKTAPGVPLLALGFRRARHSAPTP